MRATRSSGRSTSTHSAIPRNSTGPGHPPPPSPDSLDDVPCCGCWSKLSTHFQRSRGFLHALTVSDQNVVDQTRLRPGYLPTCNIKSRSLEGFLSPYVPNCASKMFTLLLFSRFFQRPTAQAPEPIFTQSTSNDVVPRKDVHFRGYNTII